MTASNALAQIATPRYFDQPAWRRLCSAACDTAARTCGASDALFTSLYSSTIDAALRDVPVAQQALALAIAREIGDYASAEELARSRAEMLALGWCTHGIDPNACPAGCGDLAAEHDSAANEETAAEYQADPHDVAQAWSFLLSKQFALEARGFEANLLRLPAAAKESGVRLVFSWVPGSCSPTVDGSTRLYALEVCLPAGAGAPVGRYAGCGIDCARTERRAEPGADLDDTLTEWFTEFQRVSRLTHDQWFVHAVGADRA